ncbi:ATP-binding protein [Streptomyces sp. NPDC006463]|uniref:ATP-binding protein n=1 Tax=Streptomyces sp. NPDC006463 TaxID=3364746 RepID=UPI003681DB75
MTIWTDLGFNQSPYDTKSLPPTAIGERLLVGREKHIQRLINRLASSSSHVTIEGEAGVGKTSLITIANYRMKRNSDKARSPILLPIEKSFQITTQDGVKLLEAAVYRAVAEAFIRYREALQAWGYDTPKVADINKWMNSPIIKNISAGVSVAGVGVSAGRSESLNASTAFAESGLANMVRSWMAECFDPPGCGYFVCVLDNLELLVSSASARQALEEIRDTILAEPGLRWVICGARGVVRTAAASPRLQGRLCHPLEVEPLSMGDAIGALEARIDEFSTGGAPPVGPIGFQYLYEILKCNLRNTLQKCEDFSFWLHDEGVIGAGEMEHVALMQSWMTLLSDEYANNPNISPHGWKLLDDMVGNEGSCDFGDYELFGFSGPDEMKRCAAELEHQNLIEMSPGDTGMDSALVAPNGWLARFSRSGYQIPRS